LGQLSGSVTNRYATSLEGVVIADAVTRSSCMG